MSEACLTNPHLTLYPDLPLFDPWPLRNWVQDQVNLGKEVQIRLPYTLNLYSILMTKEPFKLLLTDKCKLMNTHNEHY